MSATRFAAVWAVAVLAGCAVAPTAQELDREALAMIRASFRDQGIAKVDRLQQDEGQRECSSEMAPAEAVARRIETDSRATIRYPQDGRFLGDWREGERIAQNGRGMTWTDASAATSANGGNCYNCHQIDRKEVSFGNIGPSLWNYGKLRGVKDPTDPAAAEVVRYTWGKLWNSKAFAACSNMPRFGHAKVLDETQLQHVMALLLDPKSPVNE